MKKVLIATPCLGGSIDEEYFQQILEGQLRSVENKIRVGAVTFIEPTPETVGIASTL